MDRDKFLRPDVIDRQSSVVSRMLYVLFYRFEVKLKKKKKKSVECLK